MPSLPAPTGSAAAPATSRQSSLFGVNTDSRLENAPQLQKLTQSLSVLLDKSGEGLRAAGLLLFLIDEGGMLVKHLEDWLDILMRLSGNTGTSSLRALYINGLVKTGKSYVLNMILPAMLRRHPHFGIGGDKELLLCRLDFEAIAGGQDYNDALRRFLTALLTWAENGQASEELLQDLKFYDDVRLEEAIVSFIERLSRPAIFLCDELQALLVREEGYQRACNLLRTLVNRLPETAIFALTGSSCCSVGVNVSWTAAKAVPGDIGSLLRISRCNLPASVSDAAAAETWAFLQLACPEMPSQLASHMSNSLPAMQVSYRQEYLATIHRPATAEQYLLFAQRFMGNTLLMQAAKDLMPVLHKLTSKAQKDLLRLAKGDGMPVGALDHTVYQLTEPHLTSNDETAPDGNRIVHLHAPWHAALIMAMFTENGDLKTHPHGTFQLPSSQQRSAMLKRSASAAQLEDN